MKINPELMREILAKVEDAPVGKVIQPENFDASLDPKVVGEHVRLLEEDGLIDAIIAKTPHGVVHHFIIWRLRMPGHNFIASARNETVWSKTTAALKKQGADFAWDLVKMTAKHYASKLLLLDFES
jgi:hypothetical protein